MKKSSGTHQKPSGKKGGRMAWPSSRGYIESARLQIDPHFSSSCSMLLARLFISRLMIAIQRLNGKGNQKKKERSGANSV
jgi:hypothetical protein